MGSVLSPFNPIKNEIVVNAPMYVLKLIISLILSDTGIYFLTFQYLITR
jgi:hypothetical protein